MSQAPKNFHQKVDSIPTLKGFWREGLQALRPEDKPHIVPEDTRKLRGSVDVDKAYEKLAPQANRWDFAISYQHTNRIGEMVYWVELHTASDSQVKVVIKKAEWLLEWLKNDGKPLADLERSIVWVSSGNTSFTRGAPQLKKIAQAGIKYSGNKLIIPNKVAS
jgi:hypothetical protein